MKIKKISFFVLSSTFLIGVIIIGCLSINIGTNIVKEIQWNKTKRNNIEITNEDRTEPNDYIPYEIILDEPSEFYPIYKFPSDTYQRHGVLSNEYNEPDNGKFVFELGDSYDAISIDTEITVLGTMSFRHSVPLLGIPEDTQFVSFENFYLEGLVEQGDTVELQYGVDERDLADENAEGQSCYQYDNFVVSENQSYEEVLVEDKKNGSNELHYETVHWSMSLDEEGDTLTLFINDSRTVDEHEYWAIYQMWENVDNCPESYHDEIDYADYDDDVPSSYKNQNPTLTVTGYKYEGYSFENDTIDIKQTEENLYTELKPNGLPYFTDEVTYAQLEEYIITNNLIVSEDGIPSYDENNEESTYYILFYDDNGQLIDKSETLDSSTINLQLVSNESNYLVNGETEIISLEIPYINFEIIDKGYNNFYWGDIYSNEFNTGYWYYNESEKMWHYVSNTPIEIEGYYSEGISRIEIDGQSYNLNNDNESISEALSEDENWTTNNVSIKDNQSNEASFDIAITTYEGYTFEFVYDLQSGESESWIEVSEIQSSGNEGDVSDYSEVVGFDVNGNGVIEENEIFEATFVYEYGFEWTNKSEDGTIYKWNMNNYKWEYYDYNSSTITDNGIYLLIDINEFGNKVYEIVIFPPESETRSYSELDNYVALIEDTQIAYENGSIANDQGIDENTYTGYSSQEFRKLDDKIEESELIPLEDIYIDVSELAMITNQFEDGTNFNEIIPTLETEIESQLLEQNLSSEDYIITWEVNGKEIDANTTIYFEDQISLKITPAGNWTTSGSYETTFSSYTYTDLSNFDYIINNSDLLINITNQFEQGTEFGEIRIEFENAINAYLEDNGIQTEHLIYEWNLSDDDIVYYDTQIYGKVYSNNNIYQNQITIDPFNSDSYYDLSHAIIDTEPLEEITYEYNGSTWGEVEPLLEQEIESQLEMQGYPTNFINITFYDSDGYLIDEDEIVEEGEMITFELTSLNERYVKNDYKDEIFYADTVNTVEENKRIYLIIFLILLFLILLLVTFIFYRKRKNKKQMVARAKRNENVIFDNVLINEIIENDNN